MTRFQFTLLTAVILAAGAAAWTIRHSARVRLLEKNELLRQQTEESARLSAENQRLSKLASEGSRPQVLSPEQFRELLKLRGEAGQLRSLASEMSQLRATNQQVFAALNGSAKPLYPGLSASGGIVDSHYWPREQLAFAGFGDPESAMKSTLWSWSDVDLSPMLDRLTPEQRAEIEAEWAANSQPQMVEVRKRMAALYSLDKGGVSLLGTKLTTPEEATLDLYFEGDGKTRRFALRKSGAEWRVASLVAIYH